MHRFRLAQMGIWWIPKALLVISILLLIILNIANFGYSADWTDKEIVEAVFLAEGGYRATYLFGIRSVKYDSFQEAEKICYNTVRNNRKRYKDYGYKEYDTYLEFLASRYAPTTGNITEREKDLNRYWLPNVLYFLNKEGKEQINFTPKEGKVK